MTKQKLSATHRSIEGNVFWLNSKSLITRIAAGKLTGFLIGVIGFFSMPYLWPDTSDAFRWAILFWYITLGAFIAMFGILTWHPILKFSMPWWFRGLFFGAWMNFLLVLFIYDRLAAMMLQWPGADSAFTSPYWMVLEGAIVGLSIDFAATKLVGEGSELLIPEKPTL